MWPQTLEMSRDECRGMLRRLELESYSHIISVFRAQGSLSEPKAKLLEELRQLFHITQERHRAEVRRAANDEQLCTIAENVCGPNTWQEWSREGRRPYPLLPRINPQTALSIVANDLAAKAYAENAKLAAPHETGANLSDALTEQANFQIARHGIPKLQEPHVVMDEPFKVPDLPNEIKKATLKRKENELSDAKPNKKRNTQHDRQLGLGQQQQTPTGSGGSQSGVIKDEDGQAGLALEQRPNARTQQQRYFYQQHQKHKQRLGSKKGAGNALANHSAIAAGGGGINTKPAKSGRRRAQKQLQQQLQQQQKQQQLQQQQQLQEQQQQQQLQQPPPQQQLQQQKVLLSAEPTTTTTTTTTTLPHANHLVQPHVEYILDEALKSVAASKLKTVPTSVRRKVYASSDVQYVCSPIIFKEKLSPTVQQQQHQQTQQQQQQQQISTPVKKYIVEDRQQPTASPTPIASAAAASPVASISTANLPLAPQIISVQQIAAPPQVRSNPTVVSTGTATATILPPGTKLTPKKINLIDKQQLATVPNTAVRLLPLPASSYTEQTQTNPASIGIAKPSTAVQAATATVQKYIVEERVPSQSTTGTPLSSASAVNIIKNIPASSLNNTLITPLSNAVTPVTALGLRKASVAATTTVTGAGSSASTAAATSTQLLGNTIKLTSGSAIKHVRNIKICSPNGNVFLPAKLTAGSIIHKLNATNVAGASGATGHSPTASGSGAGTPTSPQPTQQRITIQKMQLLTPTQVSAATVGGGATSASAGSGKVKPTTLTLTTGAAGVGKNNLVFLPTSGMRAVTLATSKPKTGVGVGVGAELLAAKPNVLVIGPSSSSSSSSTSNAPTTIIASSSSSAVKSKAHQQLITEDTPIDIINMPIIVADNGAATEHSSKTTTPAVSSSKPAGAAAAATASMVVLNATDWEMELDQASKAASVAATTSTAAAAAATTAATTPANAAKNTKLEHVIVEEVCTEESLTQLKNQMIELQEDEDSAIEYVDMELEQPIEIESTSNISPETMTTTATTTTTSNVSSSSSSMPNSSSIANSSPATPSKSSIILLPTSDKKKQEQQVATKVEGVTAARITVTTSTLP